MKWFKFYGQDYISDPKMLSLSASERSCWITLLSYASINDNGMITFLSEEQLMIQSGISQTHKEWSHIKGILEKLEKLNMINNDNGMITIKNWSKRQETNLTSYQRVKRFRAKKRNDNIKITLEENRIDKNRIEEKKIQNTHSEFKNVKLTSEEYRKLAEKLGEGNTTLLIEELGVYLESTGKKYHSHYATILAWARRRVQDRREKVNLQIKKRTIV